jgi:hypothetical protein
MNYEMKKLNKLIIILLLAVTSFSCSESVLNEVPKSILTPEIAYVTKAQFDQAIWDIHRYIRDIVYFRGDGWNSYPPGNEGFWTGTDLAFNPEGITNAVWQNMPLYMNGTWFYDYYYSMFYALAARANVIISRATAPQSILSDEERKVVLAQGKFFRAYAFKTLANLYGGVPIIEEEVVSPKDDYVKATRSQVYEFAVADLEFARQNLSRTADPNSALITAGVADHLLAEVYLSNGQWDKSIEAASRVIDDTQYRIMTERFGKKKAEVGDVFNDLSRKGNIKRKEGNNETLWALQFEYNVVGGNGPYAWSYYNGERFWGPRWWLILDPDKKSGTVAVDSLGRGASWIRPTYWASTGVYKTTDWNDMRNSKYNIHRDWYYNNTGSAYFGKKITLDKLVEQNDTLMKYYPWIVKVSDWPDDGPFDNAQVNRPFAVYRLAETYLLRAEAFLGKGNQQKAADDINILRSRAKTIPVQSSKVNIDYILDERLRELISEELRMMTLRRLDLLYNRTMKYNPITGPQMTPRNNTWPIPIRQIELNKGAVIEQNAGW